MFRFDVHLNCYSYPSLLPHWQRGNHTYDCPSNANFDDCRYRNPNASHKIEDKAATNESTSTRCAYVIGWIVDIMSWHQVYIETQFVLGNTAFALNFKVMVAVAVHVCKGWAVVKNSKQDACKIKDGTCQLDIKCQTNRIGQVRFDENFRTWRDTNGEVEFIQCKICSSITDR